MLVLLCPDYGEGFDAGQVAQHCWSSGAGQAIKEIKAVLAHRAGITVAGLFPLGEAPLFTAPLVAFVSLRPHTARTQSGKCRAKSFKAARKVSPTSSSRFM